MKPTTDVTVTVVAEQKSLELYRSLKIEGEKVGVYPFTEKCDFIHAANPDILIIDCGDQVQSGLNLLHDLKSRRQDLPIFFLTDRSSDGAEIKAFRMGARGYFKKPLDLPNLKANIETILTLKRQGREKRSIHRGKRREGTEKPFPRASMEGPREIRLSLQYIDKNFSHELNLERLGQEARLSKYHFSRVFKKHVGMSPMKYVTFVRIQKAKELLRNKDLSVSEIAGEVGFRDLSNFTRHFRRIVQNTPSSFRKS